MKILPFDSETNALPDWNMPSESPHQPHLVSLAAALVDSVTGDVLEKMDVIVKPEGWEITQETIDIHGITMERAMDEGISEADALDRLIDMWCKCDLRTAFNATFDNRIIRIAQKRYFSPDNSVQMEWMRSWNDDKELYYCTMQGAKKAMGLKKPPKLGEAYQHFFGKPLVNAHQAMADTMACMEIYFAINGKGLLNEPAATSATPAATTASEALIAELGQEQTVAANEDSDEEVGFL